MSLILSGTDGLSDVDGTAATPAIRGTDANTGIFFPAADTIAFSEGGTESARFDSAGNLGVGTTNPTAKLDVAGGGSTGGVMRLTNTNTGATDNDIIGGVEYYSLDGDRVSFGTQLASYVRSIQSGDVFGRSSALVFGTNAVNTAVAERMRIDSSGNLLIGATSRGNAERLSIVGNAGGSIIIRMQRPGEPNAYIGTDGVNLFSVFDSGINMRFAVLAAGSCQNTTGSYGAFSDAKLKENIVDASPKLEKVMQLQVKNFNLKTDPNLKQIGFIAQELQQVFPSLIEETPDRDESGEKTGEVTLGIKTTVLIPILVKAIQEQQAMITELKATVDAQAARIAALEAAP
jgi:hypothetical protein